MDGHRAAHNATQVDGRHKVISLSGRAAALDGWQARDAPIPLNGYVPCPMGRTRPPSPPLPRMRHFTLCAIRWAQRTRPCIRACGHTSLRVACPGQWCCTVRRRSCKTCQTRSTSGSPSSCSTWCSGEATVAGARHSCRHPRGTACCRPCPSTSTARAPPRRNCSR